jgi:hypothetical protein
MIAVWRLSSEWQLAKDDLEWHMPARAVLATAIAGSMMVLAAESAAVASELGRGAWC